MAKVKKENGHSPTRQLLTNWIERASPGGFGGQLLIVKYHRAEKSLILHGKGRSIEEFESQVDLMQQTFNTMTVAEGARHLRNNTLPARALCITFDDGYAENFEIALPILEKYGAKATFFVSSGLLGQPIMWSDKIASIFATAKDRLPEVQQYLAEAGMPVRFSALVEKLKYMSLDAQETIVSGLSAFGSIENSQYKLMSAEQVRILAQRGMEVGGHTVNHTILMNADEERASDEIFGCKAQLESIIGGPVVSFAYPNGRRNLDYAERDIAIVREAGFEAAVNTEFGLARDGENLFELPRITHYFVTPLRLFRMFL